MSMQDRELLEFAAKAIGKVFVDPMSWDDGAGWNPLEDDGDALRLAIKLGIKLRWHEVLNQALVWPCAGDTLELQENGEDHSGDIYAASRRAIVRAAAEIGKAMQEQPK